MTLSRVVQVIDLRNIVCVIGSIPHGSFLLFFLYMSLVRKTSSLPFDIIDDFYIVNDTVDCGEKKKKNRGSRKRASTAATSSIIIKRQKLADPQKKKEGEYAITFCYAYRCVYSKSLLHQIKKRDNQPTVLANKTCGIEEVNAIGRVH